MSIREMAEAHLQNVQQQISELQNQQQMIEADIQKLTEYLQRGVAQLNDSKPTIEDVQPPNHPVSIQAGPDDLSNSELDDIGSPIDDLSAQPVAGNTLR